MFSSCNCANINTSPNDKKWISLETRLNYNECKIEKLMLLKFYSAVSDQINKKIKQVLFQVKYLVSYTLCVANKLHQWDSQIIKS